MKEGQIIYFADSNYDVNGWTTKVNYGIIDTILPDEIYVDLLTIKERRRINGVPFNDFKSETEWKKYPKNWDYRTRFFEIIYDEIPERIKNLRIDNPENILEGIASGWVIRKKEISKAVVEAELDRHNGWRIIKKIPEWTQTYCNGDKDYIRLRPSEIFFTYDEAKKCCEEILAERKRLENLTDYEWTWEIINKALNHYCPKRRKLYEEAILKLEVNENFDVRNFEGVMQFGYYHRTEKGTEVFGGWTDIIPGEPHYS